MIWARTHVWCLSKSEGSVLMIFIGNNNYHILYTLIPYVIDRSNKLTSEVMLCWYIRKTSISTKVRNTEEHLIRMLLSSLLHNWVLTCIPSVNHLFGPDVHVSTWKYLGNTGSEWYQRQKISSMLWNGIKPVSSVLCNFVKSKENLYASTAMPVSRYWHIVFPCS